MPFPKGAKIWLPNRRNGSGRYFHRAPDGRRWYGTAQEVREAGLMPFRRKVLADSLRIIRSCAKGHDMTREELAEWARLKRRDAIHDGDIDAKMPHPLATVDAETMLMLEAGSRLVADSFEAFVGELVQSEIESLLDVAESETGKREIPLTRYERAALERIRRERGA